MTTSAQHEPVSERGFGLAPFGGPVRSFGRSLRCWLPSLLLAWLGGCSAGVSNRNADHLDTSAYPPEIQDAYRVFAVRCSRCHTLARPLNARISDERHWIRYVARMRRQPGSGINHANADIILKFLLYYTAQVRHEEAGGDPADFPASAPRPSTSDTVPAEVGAEPKGTQPSERDVHDATDDATDDEAAEPGQPLQPAGTSLPPDPALDGAGREP